MLIFNFLSLIWIQFYLYFHPAGYVLCMSNICMYITFLYVSHSSNQKFWLLGGLVYRKATQSFAFCIQLLLLFAIRRKYAGIREFVVLNKTFLFKVFIQHFHSSFFIPLPKTPKNLCCYPSLNHWERSILYEHVGSCLFSTMAYHIH